jgi:hypothetical protein
VKGGLDRTNYGETVHVLQYLEGLDIKGILRFANACWLKDHPPENKGFMARRLLAFFTS